MLLVVFCLSWFAALVVCWDFGCRFVCLFDWVCCLIYSYMFGFEFVGVVFDWCC